MKNTMISVELDASVKGIELFESIPKIEIDKPTIFKYGILNDAVPDKIKENAFEYLEGKIPFLAGLNEDFIEIEEHKIINAAKEEKAKTISEIIGVGVGLYYTSRLFQINPNCFFRVPKPDTQGKYMDFKFQDKRKVYIETKGTIYNSSIKKMYEDILQKKRNTEACDYKVGTIALISSSDKKHDSKLIVTDDRNIQNDRKDIRFEDILCNYLLYLSFILDSHQFNLVKSNGHKIRHDMIPSKYIYNNNVYLGKCFDERLVLDYIADYYRESKTLKSLFKKLTSRIGRRKYFLGLHISIIDALNKENISYFKKMKMGKSVEIENNRYLIADIDGVLIASSFSGTGDSQIEALLSESEVHRRLELIVSYITNNPHECRAPCTSKGIEGKPCEKLTFREHCYFHRDGNK